MMGEHSDSRAQKRPRLAEESDPRAQQRPRPSNVIRLNVGGVHIDTSKETLQQLPFFRKMFELEEEHGMQPDFDLDGRVFVDRKGDLFEAIIDFLRTQLRPPQQLLQQRERELRKEADFYGCDTLLNELDGVIDTFKLEMRDRQLQAGEQAVVKGYSQGEEPPDSALIDMFETLAEFVIKPSNELKYPLLLEDRRSSQYLKVGCRSVIPASISDFEARLKTVAGDWVPMLTDPAIVIVGDAVLSALVDDTSSIHKRKPRREVDICFCGVTPERSRALVDEIMASLAKREEEMGLSQAVVIRSKAAITVLVDLEDDGPIFPQLQIMLTIYRDPLEVVINADADCCAVLYHPASHKVQCTPRAQRALNYRTNVLDTELRGDQYEGRLEKYAKRGFCVAVPGLDLSQVDHRLFEGKYLMVQPQNLLLRLGEQRSDGRPEISAEFQPTQVNEEAAFQREDGHGELFKPVWKGKKVQVVNVRASKVVPHSLERLLVLDRMSVRNKRMDLANFHFERQPEAAYLFHFPVAAHGPQGQVNWTEFRIPLAQMTESHVRDILTTLWKFIEQLEAERQIKDEPADLFAMPKHFTAVEDDRTPPYNVILAQPKDSDEELVEVALRRLAAGNQRGWRKREVAERCAASLVTPAVRWQLGFVWELCDLSARQVQVRLGRVTDVFAPPPRTGARWPAPLLRLVREAAERPEELEATIGVPPVLGFARISQEEYAVHGRRARRCALAPRPEQPRRRFLHNVYAFQA